MKESAIEQAVGRWCKGKKVVFLKLDATHAKGVPDRMVIAPNGRVLFLEFKREGGVLSFHQRVYHDRLAMLGHQVKTVFSKDEALCWIEELLT